MITLENLSFSYPNKDLYDNVSLSIEKGEHCALIGTSGSGKTTLINIMTGRNRYLFDGKLTVDPECKIGFTGQFYERTDEDVTVFDYISQNFLNIQQKIDNLCEKMADCDDLDAVMEEYQNALDEFESLGGDAYESLIMKKLNLSNLGAQRDLEISKLSGGEFKLVQLIREMISGQDLLIMDEPDAFLDFENLHSLKNLINSHKGTLLVITHNRYLLNQCFNKIIHLENRSVTQFDGKYNEYNLYLLERKIELQEMAQSDTEEIERNAKLIENLREIATLTAESVHGRALKARVTLQARLEARQVKEPFIYINTPQYKFLNSDREASEDIVISSNNFELSFEELILENVNFEIKHGEKVALIGANGTGKTSLLRQIVKNENPAIFVDSSVKICYLSQAQNETLNDENTIFEEFFELGFESCEHIENYLADFGFAHDMLGDKISSLSGGEKNTLQMAKIGSQKTDILILDEPSSHLDIYSQIALENAIKAFKGTVLMVSHDFYFIANCMDYVLFAENKTVRRMSNRKFRQMIYKKHFDKDYLQIQEKFTLEVNKLEKAILDKKFDLAKKLLEECQSLVKQL